MKYLGCEKKSDAIELDVQNSKEDREKFFKVFLGKKNSLTSKKKALFLNKGSFQVDNSEIIYINYEVYLRLRQNKKRKKGVRGEVLGEILVEDGRMKLYKVLGTIGFDEPPFSYKTNKRRVLKTKEINGVDRGSGMEYPELSSITNEYYILQRHSIFSVKRPAFFSITEDRSKIASYMILPYFAGADLFNILAKERDGKTAVLLRDSSDKLTVNQRMELTLCLLNALETQVFQHNLVHCDIKPENIIVHLQTMKVQIIDYEFASDVEAKQPMRGGTRNWLSPERYWARENNRAWYPMQAADCYAMGYILAILWGMDASYVFLDQTEQSLKLFFLHEKIVNVLRDTLFDGIDGLTSEQKELIREGLTGLLNREPENRFSVVQAKKYFNDAFGSLAASTLEISSTPTI